MMSAFDRPLVGALFSATLYFAGCAFEPNPDATAGIYGPWRWIGSSGGIVGIRPTPSDEEIELIFYFHRSGLVTIYDGDAAPSRVPFTASLVPTAADEPQERGLRYADPVTVFPFDPTIDSHTIRRMGPDTLILADPCCHRYEHTFVRIE